MAFRHQPMIDSKTPAKLLIIIPSVPRCGFVHRFIDNRLAVAARAGAALLPDDEVEDSDAGDDDRQHWDEPKLHAHDLPPICIWLWFAAAISLHNTSDEIQ